MSKPKQYQLPTQCPVCGGELEIVRARCTSCDTALEGHFSQGRFANLAPQQWHFIETFIRCKGKIKDVEVALDISYPTVVSRLSEVVRALGFEAGDDAAELRRVSASDDKRRDVLNRLNRGEINAKDALRLLESDAE
jgi:hypothetical protein